MDNIYDIRGDSNDVTMSMVRILSKQRSGFTFCHINAQSLNRKTDEFRLIFEGSNVDVVCVSETWFHKETPDSLVNLKGYKLFRNDRDGHGGGVAIYIRQHIPCKLRCMSRVLIDHCSMNGVVGNGINRVEYLFVEVSYNGNKMLVGCIYRPNSRVNYGYFLNEVEGLTAYYNDIVICGDFNCNILYDSSLTDSMTPFGLASVNNTIPTHYTTSSNSLLDLFFVSNVSKVLLYDQISASCFSKHDLIFLSYNFCIPAYEHTYTFRDFKNMDYNLLNENIDQIEWDNIYYMSNVDDKLAFLDDNILRLFNEIVPLRTKFKSTRTRPWFNADIKRLIIRRDTAFSRWKRFKTPDLKNEYRTARRCVNCGIRHAKSEFYSKQFGTALQSKRTWRTIRDIGIGGSVVNGNVSIDVNDLNAIFTNLPTTRVNDNFYNFNSMANDDLHNFEFSCVNQVEVLSSFQSIKSDAIGYDGISPKFVKIILPKVLRYVTHLFNFIIMSGQFPIRWKHARIIPIPKSNGEYRPIAILCYLSKVLEKLLNRQISEYIREHEFLCDVQSGFRSNSSCVTALIDVSENIRRELDRNRLNFLVLLDHSKAFDSVNHHTLIMKLRYFFNFSHSSTRLIASYLMNRSQSVFANNMSSSPLILNRGVPQGSVLGPLLFSLYINDLPSQLSHCRVHMYADDVQLYLSSPEDSVAVNIARLNADLERVHLWALANGLFLNPLKSKCLLMHKRLRGPVIADNIFLNNRKISLVNTAKNLGIIFNSTLTWNDHVNSAVARTYVKLRSLWATQAFTPLRIRLLLAKSYIIPGLLYGCEIFANSDSYSKRRLNAVFNNIIRYVYGLGRFSSTSSFSENLYGVSFDNLLRIRVLLSLHKIIYTRKPRYLFDNIIFARSHRGRKLILPAHRTLVSEWQFSIYSVRLWNLLPHSLQLTSNVTHFRKQLFIFFSK